MNIFYNSLHYCVVEYGAQNGDAVLCWGGYEIANKDSRREIFLYGLLASQFREEANKLMTAESTEEEVDEFLGQFDGLMSQPVVLH